VQNSDSAEERGYDGGKKIKGIKRHLAVDSLGLPHLVTVTTANHGDRAGGLALLTKFRDAGGQAVAVLVDGGYSGKPFAKRVTALLRAKTIVAKRRCLHRFKVLPKRWVVERCFGWLDKCRRLWKNCERQLTSSVQFVVLAFLAILLRRL
jgi:transposase